MRATSAVRVKTPDCRPPRSSATNRNPAPRTASRTSVRSGSEAARTRSAAGSSIRATSPWWRTRESVKPRRRSPASACSTWASFSGVTSVWCGMRDARQGAAGLSAQGSSQARASRRTAALSSPASRERRQHPVVGGRAAAGPVGTRGVVEVLPVRDGVERVGAHDLVGDPGEQLVLAVEAAVGAVGPVGRVAALVGRHLDQRRPDDLGDLVGGGALVRGEARRDPEDRDDPARPEHPDGGGQQHRRSRRHRRRRRRAGRPRPGRRRPRSTPPARRPRSSPDRSPRAWPARSCRPLDRRARSVPGHPSNPVLLVPRPSGSPTPPPPGRSR